MTLIVRSILLLCVIVITSQDIAERKGCDCSICKGVDNKINPIVGKKIGDGGVKSGCNLCEQRKEMLRMEREKQRQLQKCPFQILGAPLLKGKTSEEIFDEFRELIVPSQNSFSDMMRGVVRTMHVSSVAELNYAREKEAQELAKKKMKELEEAKKAKERKPPTEEIVSLNNPVNPKVTVVLKQTPCGPILQQGERSEPEKMTLLQKLPRETPEEEILGLQPIDQTEKDYLELNSKENILHLDQMAFYNMFTTAFQDTDKINGETEVVTSGAETTTESPFPTFFTTDESAVSTGGNSAHVTLPPSTGLEVEGVDKRNATDSLLIEHNTL